MKLWKTQRISLSLTRLLRVTSLIFVDQILTKKENPEADTSALEREIDQLVCELYELTEEEIEIVEKAVSN